MTASSNLDDAVVMITGAAGNLGRAVAEEFSSRGARLALVDLQAERLSAVFGDAGERRMFLSADLLKPAEADAAAQAVVKRFGRIDVLCNLAGGFRMGTPVHGTEARTWDFLYDLNVRTVQHMAHAVVPQMQQQGSGKIVNIGAFSAQRGLANMGAYIAAKSAVIRLTESMAAELRTQNINVNCVLPTIIDTPENRADMPDADPANWVAPRDLAQVIVFLASDAARAVHGAALPVTGLS
ncbi:SDR family NAD(P)-dependent oxidoreductase [Variovorax sp. OV329]|uniref:SDR family oxidoreductase n=1 Tax=Variovorax sp. OV329 TaxID=1882825 RepID=UPI0008ED2429|nr:SDR family NAD(P)-dependent oxidoreductase [Variovorax sp. OV329]SFM87789.1 NADP-dependent 3-hydroxy acid dehydrogenase YdfG [Variovorax sp. OV329]